MSVFNLLMTLFSPLNTHMELIRDVCIFKILTAFLNLENHLNSRASKLTKLVSIEMHYQTNS